MRLGERLLLYLNKVAIDDHGRLVWETGRQALLVAEEIEQCVDLVVTAAPNFGDEF